MADISRAPQSIYKLGRRTDLVAPRHPECHVDSSRAGPQLGHWAWIIRTVGRFSHHLWCHTPTRGDQQRTNFEQTPKASVLALHAKSVLACCDSLRFTDA